MSKTHQWTTGAVYYSILATAEAFGKSNASQVVDLNFPSDYQPGYAIYENGSPVRLALINYVNDPSGASDFNAVYSLTDGSAVPASVKVRYLEAPSVSEKFNITWRVAFLSESFTIHSSGLTLLGLDKLWAVSWQRTDG